MSDLAEIVTTPKPRTVTLTLPDGAKFVCPTGEMVEHVREVFRGEYDPGVDIGRGAPMILDIGANIGAFAVWATRAWPAASVRCYEPNPEALRLLELNRPALTTVHGVAVRAEAGAGVLRFGKNNIGEASFHELGEQSMHGVRVTCIAASELPPCDVLKIDTEGCEVEILDAYFTAREAPPSWLPVCVLYEFHSEADRITLTHMLELKGYSLTRASVKSADRGVMCWVRR